MKARLMCRTATNGWQMLELTDVSSNISSVGRQLLLDRSALLNLVLLGSTLLFLILSGLRNPLYLHTKSRVPVTRHQEVLPLSTRLQQGPALLVLLSGNPPVSSWLLPECLVRPPTHPRPFGCPSEVLCPSAQPPGCPPERFRLRNFIKTTF